MNEPTVPEYEIKKAWKTRYGTEKYGGTHFSCYSAGQRDHAAKHAEEVAGWKHTIKEEIVERAILERELTAAREREEKLDSERLHNLTQWNLLARRFDNLERKCDLATLYISAWRELENHKVGGHVRDCLREKFSKARSAYDASRAADEKEGA